MLRLFKSFIKFSTFLYNISPIKEYVVKNFFFVRNAFKIVFLLICFQNHAFNGKSMFRKFVVYKMELNIEYNFYVRVAANLSYLLFILLFLLFFVSRYFRYLKKKKKLQKVTQRKQKENVSKWTTE